MTSLDAFRELAFFVAVVFDALVLRIVFKDNKTCAPRKTVSESSWKRTAISLGKFLYFLANAAAARLIVKYLFKKS